VDNYGHKTPAIKRWLARNPRFHVHFTPTSASWLNQVERWFAMLTERQIRRGMVKTLYPACELGTLPRGDRSHGDCFACSD
jgi:hypothetical protein